MQAKSLLLALAAFALNVYAVDMPLRIDPRHKGAHEYIGEAYLQDRKPDQAEKHLGELEKICGNRSCEEYAELSKAIADYKAKN